MRELPTVSVIIPTKNSEKTLDLCLKSMRNQTYPSKRIELIVVDNFSNDKTRDIAKKYSATIFHKGPERNAQRTYGAEKSKGKYLVFIDSDMVLDSTLIEHSVSIVQSAGFDALILPEISIGDGFWANCRKLEKLCYLNDSLMETPNRFIKQDVYFAVGGYDSKLIAGEDFDLGDRIQSAGYKIGRVDSFINHIETGDFFHMLKKHYYYGKKMNHYFKKSKSSGIKRFFIIRPAYIRHWKLFLKDPIHGAGLILMKIMQYFFAFLGVFHFYILSTLTNYNNAKKQSDT